MLRSFFIYMSKAEWAKQLIMNLGFARRMSRRFVAGEKQGEAIQAIKVLNAKGLFATLDHLGEHTTNIEEARKATQDILEIVDTICQEGIQSNVSIKLSQIGFALGEDICTENLRTILEHAGKCGIFVRIDMEDSSTVDGTLKLYQKMRQYFSVENVGLVIQSYLYRSAKDVMELSQDDTYIRLCKGAYKEPADVAFPKKSDVDSSYDHLVKKLMDSALAHQTPAGSPDGHIPPAPAIATHDEKRIAYARACAEKIDLSKENFEFQMLYGIRRELQENLVQEGYKVRIYVPYGTQWYPYFMRRLAERPANLWFLMSNFFRK
jgi:proline dehydrogenase